MANPIDPKQLVSDIINAIAPHVIAGSSTLESYRRIYAKMLVPHVLDIEERINNKKITEAEVRNLLRGLERIVAINILAEDVIKESTVAKATISVLRVLQGAVNAATGFSIKIW